MYIFANFLSMISSKLPGGSGLVINHFVSVISVLCPPGGGLVY
jgi:hypothetical protein